MKTTFAARAALCLVLTAAAHAQMPPAPAAPSLSGPTWTLVEFQSMDDITLKPEAGALCTLRFADKGRLEVRAHCARGHGTWKSADGGICAFAAEPSR